MIRSSIGRLKFFKAKARQFVQSKIRCHPILHSLEERITPATTQLYAISQGQGGPPRVQVFDAVTNAKVFEFMAYDPSFQGGVRLAMADVNGDGTKDIITASGSGMIGTINVFDGLAAFNGNVVLLKPPLVPFEGYLGGLNVAAVNTDIEGFTPPDIIVGSCGGPGAGPRISVFNSKTYAETQSFWAFDDKFYGGVTVAAGDVNGDGFRDIVVGAGPGAGPHVKVFDGLTGATIVSQWAYDPAFRGGVTVAAADVVGNDRIAEILTAAGTSGGTHVRIFQNVVSNNMGSILSSFLSTDPDNSFLNRNVPSLPSASLAAVNVGASNNPTNSPNWEIFVVQSNGTLPRLHKFSLSGSDVAPADIIRPNEGWGVFIGA